jgi:hypothetical protein
MALSLDDGKLEIEFCGWLR